MNKYSKYYCIWNTPLPILHNNGITHAMPSLWSAKYVLDTMIPDSKTEISQTQVFITNLLVSPSNRKVRLSYPALRVQINFL